MVEDQVFLEQVQQVEQVILLQLVHLKETPVEQDQLNQVILKVQALVAEQVEQVVMLGQFQIQVVDQVEMV